MAALISVLNLAVVAWWKLQRNDVQTECQTQQARHDSAVKDIYTRLREDGSAQSAAREKSLAEMRDYTDEERHNLREWMQAQTLLIGARFVQVEERIKQIEQDNRECADDRRRIEVRAAERK